MKRKWRILSGVHVDLHTPPMDPKHPDKEVGPRFTKTKLITPADPELLTGIVRNPGDGKFYSGDVIETEADLSKFNSKGSVRFQRVEDSGPDDELEGFSVEQLYETAKAEEINLPPSMEKDALVNAIRGAMAYKAATSGNISTATVDDGDGLDGMTVKQLRAHAKDNEVDLDDTMSKPDIVEAIRGAGALA